MKRTGSTILALLLALTMFILGCGAKKQDAAEPSPVAIETQAEAPAGAVEGAQTQLPNPIHEVADYQALLSAVPDVLMSDAPTGATNVTYSYIDGTPAISQIMFTLDGNEYTYRGAAAAENAQTDISGVYDSLEKSTVMVAADLDELSGGEFTIKYSASGNMGLATWYYAPTECQYSVYTPTGCDVSQGIVTVVRQMLPIASVAIDVSTPSGSVEGVTVVSAQDGELIVNTADGKTLQFSLVMFLNLDIKSGEVVDISYYGDLNDWPVALSIVKSAKAPAATANQISGTVYAFTNNSVYVSTESGMVYGFMVNSATKYSGQATALKEGNSVVVTYTGADLATNVTATEINTTAVSADKPKKSSGQSSGSDSLENKRLTGYVTAYSDYDISMRTGSGHEFMFRITSLTSIYGHYTLGIGSRVRIVYDGYASDSPVAKKIEVYSDSDPDPAPTRQVMEGYLLSYGGSSILIDTDSGNQHSFAVTSSTKFVGGGQAGSPVRITYYGSEDGDKVATKVVFY